MPLAPGTSLGRYTISLPLGSGGMGEVYRAHDKRLGRDVAVKVLAGSARPDVDQLARFEIEARAVAALNHPNILSVYDAGTEAGTSFLVQELLEGGTLRETITRGPLSARRTAEIGAAIARGLAAAHDKGIVHRDIKPENIFLTADGRVKILDFGVASLAPAAGAEAVTAATPLTSAGVLVGTVSYMAPEQLEGAAVDSRCDIFALGVVLTEALSGKHPFPGRSPTETIAAILRDEPSPDAVPPGTPPLLTQVLARCLAKRGAGRFQSATDLAFALETSVGTSTTGLAAPVSGVGVRRRRKVAIAAVVAGGTAALWVALWLLAPRFKAEGALVIQQLTWRNGNALSARFAPDGQTVVYGASWEGRPRELYVTMPDSRESRRLGIEGEVLGVSPKGEMAVALTPIYNGSVMLNGGVLGRAHLAGGAPHAVAEGVRHADWAPNAADLAVVRVAGPENLLEYPQGRVLVRSPGHLASPRVSPDGSRVAYLSYTGLTWIHGHVEVVDRLGSVTALTEELYRPRGIAWSARTNEIWFDYSDSRGATALEAVTPDGRRRRMVARLREWGRLLDIAPDGRVLFSLERHRIRAFARGPGTNAEEDRSWLDGTNLSDISMDGKQLLLAECAAAGGPICTTYMRGMDGSPAVRIDAGYGERLSPDGRWATVWMADGSRVKVVPLGAGDALDFPNPDLVESRPAVWLPDSTGFVFAGVSRRDLQNRFYLQRLRGSRDELNIEAANNYVLSPDGASLLVKRIPGGGEIVDWRSRVKRPVSGLAGSDMVIAWTSEGVFVTRDNHAVPRVVDILDPATGRRLPWRVLAPPGGTAGVIPYSFDVIVRNRDTYAYAFNQTFSDIELITGLR